MRLPGLIKAYYRYYQILAKNKVYRLNDYVSVFRQNSAVKILDLLPFRPEIIFDVGACEGLWTKSYYNIIRNRAKFYLFEPNPALYDKLKAIFSKCNNVYIFDLALSSEIGSKSFNIARKPDFSSLETIIQSELELHYPQQKIDLISRINVNAETLDNFYRNYVKTGSIDIMKLDVQGHELRILEGAINTLKMIKSVLVEWNIINFYNSDSDFINVHRFLMDHDFVLSSIPYQHRANGRLIYADAFYINRT